MYMGYEEEACRTGVCFCLCLEMVKKGLTTKDVDL